MCIAQMQRYLSRHGQNQRPSEDERTFMKVAVYAFRAHLKMSEPEEVISKKNPEFSTEELYIIHNELKDSLLGRSQVHSDKPLFEILEKITMYLTEA